MDFASILEEIALEGLDGITLNALWQRLDKRPKFPKANLDQDSKKFIWQYLSGCKDVEFYTLPEPRAELIIVNYMDYINKDFTCQLPLDTPSDIYALWPIESKGIKGNCQSFLTRANVTSLVRDENGKSLLSMEEVYDRWGQSFVMVASQEQRSLALCGYTFNPAGLSKDVYCTLECVGRARTVGELTACKFGRGLSQFKVSNSPKTTLFSTVKLLVHYGLVTKQPFTVKYGGSPVISQVRLVFLRRFTPMTSARHRTSIKDVSNYLLAKPNQMAEHREIMKVLGLSNKHFKKMKSKYKTYLASEVFPYRTIFPDSESADWRTRGGQERSLRMVKLLKPYVFNDVTAYDSDEDSADDEDMSFTGKDEDIDEDEYEEVEKMDESDAEMRKTSYPVYHQPLINQIMMLIKKSGERGIVQKEIKNRLNLGRLRLKYCFQELQKANAYTIVYRSKGKNSVGFLVSTEASEKLKVKKEEEKIKQDATIDLEDTEVVKTFSEAELNPETLKEIEEKINDLNIIFKEDRGEVKQDQASKKDNDKKDSRKQFIVQYLSEVKAVHAAHVLYAVLLKHEANLGMKEQMCRKSFRKILSELQGEGKIYIIKIASKDKPDKVIQEMVVDATVPADSVVVKTVLLSAPMNYLSMKFKHPVVPQSPQTGKQKPGPKKKISEQEKKESPNSSTVLSPSPTKTGTQTCLGFTMVSICDLLDTCVEPESALEVKYISPKERKSWFLSKFERAEVLHKYLFYLLYDYKGKAKEASGPDDEVEFPTVYLDVEDWRRYLPPLKKHNSAVLKELSRPGTCLMGDIILHMPLEMFCQLINNNIEIPGLQELLNEPRQKHYPIVNAPPSVLALLLYKRRYRGKIKDNLTMLCHMGLLSFGPLINQRDLEFVSFYLHTKALLLDTRKSLRCYTMTRCPEGETFDQLNFQFQNMEEVSRYWHDLWRISLFSKMGSISVGDIKGSHGSVTLIDAQKPKPFDMMLEENWLPGDRRGAAGLDTTLFAHRINNWNVDAHKRNPGMVLMMQSSISTDIVSDAKKAGANSSGGEADKDSSHKVQKKSRLPRANVSTDKDDLVKPPVKRKAQSVRSNAKKSKIESLSAKKAVYREKKSRRQNRKDMLKNKITCDSKDKEALKLLKKLRASFTPLENGMILLFEVSSCLLHPKAQQCVHSSFLRDLLHQLLQESKDKTANAVKGKSLRLMKDRRFRCYLSNYIAQALSDEKIADKIKKMKRPQIFSQEMQAVFTDLFYTLKEKFSSPKSLPVYIPSTLAELNEHYTVNTTEHFLYSGTKLTDFVVTPNNIKTMVVWELLKCCLHLKTPVQSDHLFFTLSKYPDDTVHSAYNLLRSYGIIVKLKGAEKDSKLLTVSSALLNSHKCMLRHTEALKPQISAELFKSIVMQLEHLRSASGALKPVPGEVVPSSGAQPAKDVFVDIDLNKYQGGVVVTLMTTLALKQGKVAVHIPDEMVQLDEEGRQKLTFKQPQTEFARKRKLAALMESDEDSLDEFAHDESSGIFQEERSGRKVASRPVKRKRGTDGSFVNPDTSTTEELKSCDPEESAAELKTINLDSVTLTLRDMKISASSVLSNFTVWVGSGSLVTLARTSIIEKLDLLTSRCLLQRNFIVEPLKIKLALCSSDLAPSTQVHEENVGKGSSSDEDQQDQMRIGINRTPDIFQTLDFGLFHQMIAHLEKCFSSSFDQDDMGSILQAEITPSLHMKAKVVLEVIDKWDRAGVSDEDLEKEVCYPGSELKAVLQKLIQADLVFNVGILDRRYVSRRHAKIWMVEVLRPQQPDTGNTNTTKPSPTFLYVCRLWRHFSGGLNPEGLKLILVRVLSYLMLYPGCLVSRLCHMLNPDVLPASTLDALDILETLGCIKIVRVSKLKAPDMFTRRIRYMAISDDLSLADCERSIEVPLDAPVKLAYFLDTVQKHTIAKVAANI